MTEDFSRYFKPGRVHRQIYTDPAIFDLEMERIFGAAWIYIGHESQVKKPGDYFATQIGRRPVVMVRDEGGEVRVIHNQCAHRGAMVVATEKGNATEFTCCYHGWTYHLDGRIKGVPLNHGYPSDFDAKNPKVAMRAVPRVTNYRGFVFASEAAEGPSLEESLGHILTSLDDMIDRAPDGELEVAGGTFKHAYDGNWKLYFENLCDAAHPIFAHRSSIEAAQAAVRQRALRRLGRDRDPPDAPERRALQLLGIPGRHLDLSERPQLSRRLPRRLQAGRRAERPGVPRLPHRAGEEEGQGGGAAHPRGAALELQHLSERLADEPVPAVARGASDRGRPHRGADLQLPAEGRARADVPQHHRVRQRRQRHRLAGADRRSRNLQPDRPRAFQRGRRMAAGRPRLPERPA